MKGSIQIKQMVDTKIIFGEANRVRLLCASADVNVGLPYNVALI